MKLSDFRVGWRLLIKEPAYSGAAIAGLAIGFAACILLLGFVRYCFTYNAHLKDSEQIVVVKERRNFLPRPEWRVRGPAALKDVALASGAGVSATRSRTVEVAARYGAHVAQLELRVVDANYLAFFWQASLDGGCWRGAGAARCAGAEPRESAANVRSGRCAGPGAADRRRAV